TKCLPKQTSQRGATARSRETRMRSLRRHPPNHVPLLVKQRKRARCRRFRCTRSHRLETDAAQNGPSASILITYSQSILVQKRLIIGFRALTKKRQPRGTIFV